MPGLDLNFGSSIVKREAKPARRVKQRLQRDGWREISEVANGRVTYWSKTNFSITVIEGPLGTTIIPSGPIRGKVFGDIELFSRDGVLGISQTTGRTERQAESQMKGSRRTGERTIL